MEGVGYDKVPDTLVLHLVAGVGEMAGGHVGGLGGVAVVGLEGACEGLVETDEGLHVLRGRAVSRVAGLRLVVPEACVRVDQVHGVALRVGDLAAARLEQVTLGGVRTEESNGEEEGVATVVGHGVHRAWVGVHEGHGHQRLWKEKYVR